MNDKVFGTGLALVAVGVIPTPDDITLVSPAVQISLGLALMGLGYFMKK